MTATTRSAGPRSLLLAAVCLVACGMLVGARALGADGLAAIAKLLASTAFLAVAWTAGATESRYGRTVLTGLFLCWIGDMFLLGEGSRWFLSGLVAFLAGHVAYVAAFAGRGLDRRWLAAAAVPVAVLSFGAIAWLAPHLPGDMAMPVRAYALVISAMVIAAYGAKGAGAPLLVPFGATLFYVSDLAVAAVAFTDPVFPHYVWGLPFYYTGQLMLALSTARAAAPDRIE